ncbi:RICIN domain-containing protein [Streptomyces sp. NPDC000405]|uniref:RICIN domain-containing protein n=1 Tax=Streptomyces sp. NPDC000405 TaxID=3161033 RepID=UPI00398CFB1B
MTRTARTLITFAFGLAAVMGTANAAYASFDDGPFVRLQVEHSSKCLTIKDGTMREGANAVQMKCVDGLDNQLFRMTRAVSGTFNLQPKHSGSCLSSGEDFGWEVGQRWCYLSNSRDEDAPEEKHNQWTITMVEVADRLYELRPLEAPEYCLSISNGSVEDGATAHIGRCGGYSSQRWRMQRN